MLIKGLNAEQRKSLSSGDLTEESCLINLRGDCLQRRCVPAKSPKIASIRRQLEGRWLSPLENPARPAAGKGWSRTRLRGRYPSGILTRIVGTLSRMDGCVSSPWDAPSPGAGWRGCSVEGSARAADMAPATLYACAWEGDGFLPPWVFPSHPTGKSFQ